MSQNEPVRHEVEDEGVRIARQTTSRGWGTVFRMAVDATGADPVAVRVANPLPPGVDRDAVRIHPDERPADVVLGDDALLFEVHVAPGDPVSVQYAVKGDDVDGTAADEPVLLDTATRPAGDRGEASPFETPLSESSDLDADGSPEGDETTGEGPTPPASPNDDGGSSGIDMKDPEGSDPVTPRPSDSASKGDEDEPTSIDLGPGGNAAGDADGDDSILPDDLADGAAEDDAKVDAPREGPSFGPGVDSIEPDSVDASQAEGLMRGGAASDGGSTSPSPGDPDGPDAATDSPDPVTSPGSSGPPRSEPAGDPTPDAGATGRPASGDTGDGSVVDQLVAELDDRDLDEAERETLLSALGVDPPSRVEAKVDHLQTQVSEVQAYADVLRDFVDEHGTTGEVVENLEGRIDGLRADLEATDEEVESLAQLSDDLGEELDDLADQVERLEGRHEGDVRELRTSIDELETLQDKLSTAFSGVDGE